VNEDVNSHNNNESVTIVEDDDIDDNTDDKDNGNNTSMNMNMMTIHQKRESDRNVATLLFLYLLYKGEIIVDWKRKLLLMVLWMHDFYVYLFLWLWKFFKR